MRELKFRALLPSCQWLYYRTALYGTVDYTLADRKTESQYTGLKDTNGIEIYEGDIIVYYLMDHNGDNECYREVVEWSVCGFRLTLPTSNYEVIGNIYENPELLQENESE